MNTIVLRINNISANVFSTANAVGTFRVQINTAFGGIIQVNNGTNIFNTFSNPSSTPITTGLSTLSISLLDSSGGLLQLGGCEHEISLGLSYT